MMNFDTENLVMVCYPQEAGGKFLVNCLGLNDQSVFQSGLLVEKQLKGKFTVEEKFNFLKTQLSNVKKHWNDLGLGCVQLFGIDRKSYITYSSVEECKNFDFNPEIFLLSQLDLKFFIVAHDNIYASKIIQLWRNAKIILFFNSNNFIKWRYDRDSSEFGDIEVLPKNNIIHYFDNDIYFNSDHTVSEIKLLYDKLNLLNFNEPMIREYHKLWIEKLKEIKKIDKPK